jgi:hypothetical protein
VIKKITIITLLIVIVGFFVHVNQKTYSTFVDFLPSKVRSNYIEYILDDRAGIGSDYIKILLLQALEREEYEFNIRLLFPLCDRTDTPYAEPIPQLAVKVIYKNKPSIIDELIEYYNNDEITQIVIEKQLEKISLMNSEKLK